MIEKKTLNSLWVRFRFSAQMAGFGVFANPLRSILTILGVAIGVASVISLMGIGEGARLAVVEQFKSLGSNVIVIEAHHQTVEFEPEEAEEILERVTGVDMATPVVHAKTSMRWRRTRGNANIVGVNNEYPQIKDHPLIAGRFFTNLHVKQRSPVAVLGYNIGASLMSGRNPVGQTITLNGRSFRVVGVLSLKGEGKADDIDDAVLVPYTTALQFAEKKTVEQIWVKASSPKEADLAVVQMGRIFKRKLGIDQKAPTPASDQQNSEEPGMEEVPREVVPEPPRREEPTLPGGGDDLITITSLNQLVDEADKANRVMTLLLGGIAAVSLLVGGLGIMNIMLVAVTERTEEIGIRRALGAKQGDLLTQFLLEALYLSGIGAIAGIAGAIWGLNLFAHGGFETAVSFQAIKIATGVALASGLLFGIYPAMSASSVMPVEALRRQ